MAFYKRKNGEEQPYWPVGKYKLRLPFVHYRLEMPEFIQGFVIFTIGFSMIEILTSVIGMSFEAALAVAIITQFLMLIPSTFGVPFVSGFITPALPLLVLYVSNYEPGSEAIQALVAVQLIVAVIFLILGLTGFGKKFVLMLPRSLKAGILIGAGISAIMTEIQAGGRVANTPISLIIGGILCLYIMYSLSFKRLSDKNRFLRQIANFGIMPPILIAIIIGWVVGEYPPPKIEWGITLPNVAELWNFTPFSVGFPGLEMIILAIPTGILAYIIAFGDIIVGQNLVERASKTRQDEKIVYDVNQVHNITAFRNFLHALFVPHPGLAGPIFTAGTASVSERYSHGRKAMDSIFSGANTLVLAFIIAAFFTPLITLFQPYLPIALSITLILTGYVCINIGMQQINSDAERGVAGVMAIVLALYGATYGLLIGLVLYFAVEKGSFFRKKNQKKEQEQTGTEPAREFVN